MKTLLLILLLIPLSAIAQTAVKNQDGSVTVQIPKEVMDKCAADGGCYFISMKGILEIMRENKEKLCDEKSISDKKL